MRTLPFFILSISIFFLVSCATEQTSIITGSDYDEGNNQTKYFVMPYGSAQIPGKWNKMHYNSVSSQQFFMNSDSITVGIAYNRFNNYEFNKNGNKQGFEFVKAFYDYDFKIFVSQK